MDNPISGTEVVTVIGADGKERQEVIIPLTAEEGVLFQEIISKRQAVEVI